MKSKTKKQKRPTKYVMKMNNVILHPTPTALKPCPRCEKEHKKIVPQKFGIPMDFRDRKGKFVERASHWVLCPKTKEPVLLFERWSRTVTKATFTLNKAFALKAGEEKKPAQINVKYQGKTQSWVYDTKAKKAEKRP